ncbi:MAG: transcriptional repressor [Desulfovibrio sp.]|nr:transcriptional repressor [Desulfovibrio sp.]
MGCRQTRMTRQRAVILEELCNVKTHPTADELYNIVRRRLPKISLGTVYRNLDFLEENGKIVRLGLGAIRHYDGDVAPHHHVRCIYCGRIADIAHPVHALPLDAVTAPGFAVILAVRVEFDGVCGRCAGLAGKTGEA